MTTRPETKLELILSGQEIPPALLLQTQKCRMRVDTGCSLEGFIRDQLKIAADYLKDRIQTIFIDGKAVDDVAAAVVRAGSIIALSAAMPGLAGATLRRGGYYAALRSQISHHEQNRACTSAEGIITLKLFNLLIREIGPTVLRHGIIIKADRLQSFFASRPAIFFQRLKTAIVNGQQVPPEQLQTQPWGTDEVVVQVTPTAP